MKPINFILIFIVTAPFLLLPAVFARMNRRRDAARILLFNVALWIWLIASLLPIFSDEIRTLPIPRIGAGLGLILWLVLLHFSLRKNAAREDSLDEAVTLAPYDPAWPGRFETESMRIRDALGLPEGAIEHIGSTAVPGLHAKPAVDLMLGLPSYPPAQSTVNRLVILGYEDLGEASVPLRRYLRLRGQAEHQADFNLHLVKLGGEHWTNNLALRELLRADAGARERYSQAKQAALRSSGGRLLAYSAAKAETLRALLAEAQAR
jgi:GrpB-like predicted nucleotidyltransferase (UPF0157 family)